MKIKTFIFFSLFFKCIFQIYLFKIFNYLFKFFFNNFFKLNKFYKSLKISSVLSFSNIFYLRFNVISSHMHLNPFALVKSFKFAKFVGHI
jgi:hypothetical protein